MSGDSTRDVLNTGLNIVTNVGTGGLVGYDENGFSMSSGVLGAPVEKGLKDVTGATAAEEANKIAREQVEAEREQVMNDRKMQQQTNYRNQLAASRSASAARRRQAQASGGLGNEVDFLGL